MVLRKAPMLATLATVALVVASCRGGDDDDGGGGETGDISTGTGVTSEPCEEAVNEDNGCISLGILSDLTEGPFAALGQPITEGQKAFWARVNADGGIGGFDIDVTTNVRDNKYDPEVHRQVFDEIKGDVLGLAQTLGSPHTAAIMPQLEGESIVSAPASFASEWAFADVILETGAPYCVEAMNNVDHAVDELGAESILHVHFPGDYGEDGKNGAEIAAGERDVDFSSVETTPGADNQTEAISQIVGGDPDVVLLNIGPTETGAIVGQAAAQGYQGQFMGAGPTWHPSILGNEDLAQAMQALYMQSSYSQPFGADTPGHQAVTEALGEGEPNDFYLIGWLLQYPLKAAIEAAVESGDLTREGLLAAASGLTSVDYEGMLPAEAGNYAGEPNDAILRQSVINSIDPEAPTGLVNEVDFFTGPTAEAHEFTEPCFG